MLSDGVPVEIRPIRPDDSSRLAAFHSRQSPESIYFRYFRARPVLSDKELEHLTNIDYIGRMAFVAIEGETLLAVARYEAGEGSQNPEIAFFVDDDNQGRGLATLLLEYLAAAARSRGYRGFVASVLGENYAMLGVFRAAGFEVATRFADGLIEVDIDLSVTEDASSAIAARAARARSQSVARLLRPRSVAVVGASREPGSVGQELVRHLLEGDFDGELFPINPQADQILGQQCWPSLRALGRPVDLAIVAVASAAVEEVVAEAAAVGVSSLLIVSSGFSETGPAGIEREMRLVKLARSNGMRLLGPNSFGLVNTDPEIRLRALFLPVGPDPGAAALLSQSGPLGSAVLDLMRRTGVGISSFVAVGNRADVSVNDLVDYWASDEQTKVVLLYVENYGNLRTFAGTARAVSMIKPMVAMRPPDQNLVELASQAGVILVDTVAELADMARVAGSAPLPRGRRVVVISNAASVGRLAAAALRRCALEPVVPDAASHQSARGDVVLIGDADNISADESGHERDYEQLIVAAAVDAEVDAVLIAMIPTLTMSPRDLSRLIDRVDRFIDKPIVAAGLIDEERLDVERSPVFMFPDEAARALGRLVDYADWRREEHADLGPSEDLEAHRSELEAEVRPALVELLGDAQERTFSLWSPAGRQLVDALGVAVAEWAVVTSRSELLATANQIGYPVVLKAAGMPRRTVGEAGGVAIDLHNHAQLEEAFDRMLVSRGSGMLPAVVQRMVAATANVKVEVVQDPDLGAFATIGVGGSVGLAMPSASRRFLPLIAGEIDRMVAQLALVSPMTEQERLAVGTAIGRLAAVAAVVPELSRVQLDPVLLAGDATVTADLTVQLRPWHHNPWTEVRKLT